MGFSRKNILLVTSALALVAGHARAQTTQAAPAEDSATVPEVIVTAQRRSDSLQKTPVAITALSPEALQARSVQTTQDLMQVTPGLQVSTQTAGNGGGSATFFLRGMGQQRSGNGTSPAVGIYVDDFYYPSLQGSVFSILDLQQVEVLRGPQGTLFGRNTIGGAIRYTTKKPEFDDNSGYIQGTFGSYDRKDANGSANLALSDKAAMRVTLGRLRTDGYVKQQNGGEDAGGTATDLARLQLRFAPTDKLDINLGGQYTKSKLDGFTYNSPGPISPIPGTLPFVWNALPAGRASPYDNRYVSTCDYCQSGTNKREFSNSTYKSLNATVAWEVTDAITVKSLTGWQRVSSSYLKDLDGSPLPINDSVSSGVDRAFSQELQVNGRMVDDRLNWVLGGYYYDERHTDLYPEAGAQTTLGGSTPPVLLTGNTSTKAAFIDGTYKLTDRLTVLGGYRYSVDDKDAVVRNVAGATVATAAHDFGSSTWRFGGQMQWTDQSMTYVSVSRGFRAGGFGKISNTSPVLDSFDPENATNYEVGARLDLFGRRVRINPTLFYTKWSDIQVQRVVAGSTGVQIFVDNAAKAHSQGFELETEAAVTSNFRLFGSLALLDIQYDEVGATTSITKNSKFQRAPKTTYVLGGNYHDNLTSDLRLNATLNWSRQAHQYSSPSDSDQLLLPAYSLLSARVEISSLEKHWTLTGFVTNATDKVYYVGGADYAHAGTGSPQLDLGRPREFGVAVRLSF